MVKRLRHHPFTVVSRVRISVGSPSKPLRLMEESHHSAKYRRTKVRGQNILSKCRCCLFGSIAQLGEHLPYKQGVTGSSPVTSTIKLARVDREKKDIFTNVINLAW